MQSLTLMLCLPGVQPVTTPRGPLSPGRQLCSSRDPALRHSHLRVDHPRLKQNQLASDLALKMEK